MNVLKPIPAIEERRETYRGILTTIAKFMGVMANPFLEKEAYVQQKKMNKGVIYCKFNESNCILFQKIGNDSRVITLPN